VGSSTALPTLPDLCNNGFCNDDIVTVVRVINIGVTVGGAIIGGLIASGGFLRQDN
jgi:hypothetical protein